MNRALSSLRKNEAFRTVYQKGRSYAGDALIVYIIKTQGTGVRFGISISKKSGNAVVRHRFQRVIREIIRTNRNRFLSDADIVIVARKGTRYEHARDVSYQKTEQALCALLERAHLIEAHTLL